MRIGELWLNKLGLVVPKPKEQVLLLVELLLHSVVTKKDIPDLIKLLEKEFNVKDIITPQALETVGGNLELIKLASSNTAASLYLKLLPELTIHRQDKMNVTCKVYSVREIGEALNTQKEINNIFKSVFYKAVAMINEVLEKDLLIVKRVGREQSYKIVFISNITSLEHLRSTLHENDVKSVTDLDKYESLWRSKVE
jgi:hypothetical protein